MTKRERSVRRTILKPHTPLQCRHGCEVPGGGIGEACLVVNLSFLCCCLSFAACGSWSSWKVAPSFRQFLQVDLCRAVSSQFKLLMCPCSAFSGLQVHVANRKLGVEYLLWEASIRHLYDVACPSQLMLCDSGGDAVYVCIIQDADVCPLLFPDDTQDFPEGSLMVGLQSS